MKKIKNSSKKTVEQLRKEQEDNALRKQLAISPDLLIQRKGSDKALEQRAEKIKLISGETIDLKELAEYIDDKINTYKSRFTQGWYKEVFRLNGWEIPKNGKISKKPQVVAKYTIDIIYGRFPKEVLPVLEHQNKYDKIGIRLFKHFQFLTPEKVTKLEDYIKESEVIMKRCKTWSQFEKEHAKVYGLPFQLSIFD
ncbi:P63C domain-containing protein [Tunicatimonas pelagia]|uniref:P63C domain-containing protein n=1 Tax=Tunicatimonas pelagia TaxID=931531 RepID=UPI002665841E|nr:P63C domain-containing protein [Tunicatimonas pelagia]WKN42215.1 P63C domain-containing protein [Tunicatimonas pelagia]WKN45333.1 P63C domain-containing protein [Tunicatimonas pelagia]